MRREEKAGDKDKIAEDENATAVVVTLGLDVSVGHQEHRQDDGDDIPAREDQAIIQQSADSTMHQKGDTNLNVFAAVATLSPVSQAENATMAGIWSRQTWRA